MSGWFLAFPPVAPPALMGHGSHARLQRAQVLAVPTLLTARPFFLALCMSPVALPLEKPHARRAAGKPCVFSPQQADILIWMMRTWEPGPTGISVHHLGPALPCCPAAQLQEKVLN